MGQVTGLCLLDFASIKAESALNFFLLPGTGCMASLFYCYMSALLQLEKDWLNYSFREIKYGSEGGHLPKPQYPSFTEQGRKEALANIDFPDNFKAI